MICIPPMIQSISGGGGGGGGGGVDKTLIECKTIVHLMHVYWSVASTKND